MKNRLILKNEIGVTLVESLVGAALIGILVVAVMSAMRETAFNSNTVQVSTKLRELYVSIDKLLNSELYCSTILNQATDANKILRTYTQKPTGGDPSAFGDDTNGCFVWSPSRLRFVVGNTPPAFIETGTNLEAIGILKLESARMCNGVAMQPTSGKNAIVIRMEICKGSVSFNGTEWVCSSNVPGAATVRKYFFMPAEFDAAGTAYSCLHTTQTKAICQLGGGVWDDGGDPDPKNDRCNICQLNGRTRNDMGPGYEDDVCN